MRKLHAIHTHTQLQRHLLQYSVTTCMPYHTDTLCNGTLATCSVITHTSRTISLTRLLQLVYNLARVSGRAVQDQVTDAVDKHSRSFLSRFVAGHCVGLAPYMLKYIGVERK